MEIDSSVIHSQLVRVEMLGTGRGRGGAKEGSSSLFLLRETNLVRRSVPRILRNTVILM